MLRRARIAFAIFALASLCASPALLADDENGSPAPDPEVQQGDNSQGEGDVLDWLLQLLGLGDLPNDEFNPQHLPGG